MTYRIVYWEPLFNDEGVTRHIDFEAVSDADAETVFAEHKQTRGVFAPAFKGGTLPRLERVERLS